MASCASCGTTILIGGVRDGESRFCNEKCHEDGFLLDFAGQIPSDVVEQETRRLHAGLCPRCQGSGPVDVHNSYRIWSALLLTNWGTRPHVCCRACGIKSQLGDLLFSGILGWWGFPWGLVMTPVQVLRNVSAMVKSPDPLRASARLTQTVRVALATQVLEEESAAD